MFDDVHISHLLPDGNTGLFLCNLKRAVYFSIVTFSTVGYGDLYPDMNSAVPWLCNIESLLGLMLMGLFVVSVARSVLRG
jgi:hypothetical protein